MTAGASSEITLLLGEVAAGRERTDRLLHALYAELRQLAHARLARERGEHTLSATALVHEAWLRLVRDSAQNWANRAHFFAAAAEAMRRILVEHARARVRVKRDGERTSLAALDALADQGGTPETVLLLDDALTRLAARDAQMAQVATLRFYVGLDVEETALALGISPRSVNRLWTAARAWLLAQLEA